MQGSLFARIALVGACFALPAKAPADLTAASSRKAAPNFSLTDSKGAPVKLSDYRGRVILLDFWATWCGGCKVEIPWYMEFQRKYKSSGLSAIGVSLDEDGWKSVKPFLKRKPINYPIVVADDGLAKLYGVEQMPLTLLIDRDGKIADVHAGMVDKDSFEGEIQALLRDGTKSAATR
jgi:peroxiredoxin